MGAGHKSRTSAGEAPGSRAYSPSLCSARQAPQLMPSRKETWLLIFTLALGGWYIRQAAVPWTPKWTASWPLSDSLPCCLRSGAGTAKTPIHPNTLAMERSGGW